jgi:hypothetical protein
MTGTQQIPVTGKKLQQIEQPMDIATASAGTILTRQVSQRCGYRLLRAAS